NWSGYYFSRCECFHNRNSFFCLPDHNDAKYRIEFGKWKLNPIGHSRRGFRSNTDSGAGDITLAGNVGTPRIGDLTITSTNNITVEAITAESLNLMSATGLATLNGGFDTNGVLGITLVGNNFLSNGTITTTNGGPLTITNSGLVTALSASTITLNGGGAFTQNGT